MRKADNLPPSCAVVTKSGSLNFLEPSGPLRARNGTAFLHDSVYLIDVSLEHILIKRHLDIHCRVIDCNYPTC